MTTAVTPQARNHAALGSLASRLVKVKFHEKDGSIVDMIGNDWGTRWGKALKR